MTGLCRLIRGCAAQTAGPFVRRSERRKLAVLIPLFMSGREKKPSTLQPCPLHPFRGRREEEGSSPVPPTPPPGAIRFPLRLGLGSPPGIPAKVGEGDAFREPQLSASGKWGQRPQDQRIQIGGPFFFFFFASVDRGHRSCLLFPFSRRSGIGQYTPIIPCKAGLRSRERPEGDNQAGALRGADFVEIPGTDVAKLVPLRVSGLTVRSLLAGPLSSEGEFLCSTPAETCFSAGPVAPLSSPPPPPPLSHSMQIFSEELGPPIPSQVHRPRILDVATLPELWQPARSPAQQRGRGCTLQPLAFASGRSGKPRAYEKSRRTAPGRCTG